MRTDARSRFDDIISNGQRPLGAFVMSNDSSTSSIYSSAGYDFVIIDREHGLIDLASSVNHVRAVEMNGSSPIIRLLDPTPPAIQQALDAGAHGVIVPKAHDVEQIRKLVAATRYQAGGRGMCPQTPGANFDATDWRMRSGRHNDNVLLIPLIETAEGVRNAAAIAAIDGIDYMFFGPADLSQDHGLDLKADRALIVTMFDELLSVVTPTGVKLGAPVGYGFDDKAHFLTIGSDVGSIRTMARDGLTRFRASNV